MYEILGFTSKILTIVSDMKEFPAKHVLGTHQKCLTEVLLMSTHMFSWQNRKNINTLWLKTTPYLGAMTDICYSKVEIRQNFIFTKFSNKYNVNATAKINGSSSINEVLLHIITTLITGI